MILKSHKYPVDSPQAPSRIIEVKGVTWKVTQPKTTAVFSNVDNYPDEVNPMVKEIGIRSMVATPIIIEQRVEGGFFLNSLVIRDFPKWLISVMEQLASYAALALHSGQQSGSLRSLYDAGRAITATLEHDLNDTLAQISQQAVNVINITSQTNECFGYVGIVKKDELHFSGPDSNPELGKRLSSLNVNFTDDNEKVGIAGRAGLLKATQLVNDVTSDEDYI